MKKKMSKLSSKEIHTLKRLFRPLRFTNPFTLVYEKQIPNTGVVLIDGELGLTRQKKVLEKIEPGSILGIHQILNNEPVKLGCKVGPDSEVIILQKSDIIEALENEGSDLHAIIIKASGEGQLPKMNQVVSCDDVDH